MSYSRRKVLKITIGAALAGALLPVGGAGFLCQDAFAKSGSNGNGNGNGNGNNGNGSGGGNGGGNGNSGGSTGNGNGNNGRSAGTRANSADTDDTEAPSIGAGVQATRSANGSIRVRHGNGITEAIVSNRYVMKDAKGRMISNRVATQADITRLSRYLR